MNRHLMCLCGAALLCIAVACNDDATPASAMPNAVSDGRPDMSGKVPAALAAFEATVSARLEAGHYAYMQLIPPDGDAVWLATMGNGAPAGARVAVRAFSMTSDFRSRRLDRSFRQLLFGRVTAL